jgi:hypothetical protein
MKTFTSSLSSTLITTVPLILALCTRRVAAKCNVNVWVEGINVNKMWVRTYNGGDFLCWSRDDYVMITNEYRKCAL